MQFDLPRPFGRYTLLRSFGHGGMGGAYLAATELGDAEAMRLCVVKLGLPDARDELALDARLADEARAMLRLSSPNVVTVFDVGSAEGVRYMAMEHVEGRDLDELIGLLRGQRAALPVPVAVLIGREIARGLHSAHELGVIHRDVSPSNVVVSFSGEVKLIDFGLARTDARATRTAPGVVLGHLGYLAPERLRGERADARSDIYALGAIMWELLTGDPLFPGRALGAGTAPVRTPAPSSRRADVPPELDEIVLRALAPTPGARYADAETFRAALAGYLAATSPTIDSAALAAEVATVVGQDVIEAQRRERSKALADLAERQRDGARGAALAGELGNAGPGAIGSVLAGKYRIERLCGSGGMGDVYQATHVEIGRKVAVKILKAEYRFANDVVERFAREARLAAMADHQNIVEMLDAGTTPEGIRYLVMEYVEGETVQQLLEREERLPLERALSIALAIARAFEKAHDAGIIHRDLKPGNVMVAPSEGGSDLIKVLDFGVSKALERDEVEPTKIGRSVAPLGSPLYMAPEQARGEESDRRTDVYAVGELLYEMITGWRPWEGSDTFEIIRRKSTVDPRPPREFNPDVPEALEQVIMTALERDPNRRQQTMGVVRRQLEACAAELDGTIEPPRRHTRAVVGLAAMGLMAAVAIGAVVMNHRSERMPGASPRPGVVVSVPAARPLVATNIVGAAPSSAPSAAVIPTKVDSPASGASALTEIRAPDTERKERPARKERKQLRTARPALPPPAAPSTNQDAPATPPPSPGASQASGEEALAMARQLFGKKRYGEALIYARQAAAAAQSSATAHLVLGDVLFMLTQYGPSRTEYETALKIDPNNRQAALRLVQLERTVER